MTRRDEICNLLAIVLSGIKSANHYNLDFEKFSYWQSTPSEYEKNHLNFRDESEDYQIENTKYDASLSMCIEAIVVETSISSAAELGTLALQDLIKAVKLCHLPMVLFNLKRSHKYVETKGKTAALVELEIQVLYKF